MCVGTVLRTVRIALEIAPVEDPYGGLATVHPIAFEPFDLEGPLEHPPITLPSVILVQGVVRDAERPLDFVSADIELTLVSPIPGAPSTRVVVSASETFRVAEDAYRFTFGTQLQANSDYEVVVRPTGDWRSIRPPMRFAAPYHSPPGGGERFEWLEYPPFCDPDPDFTVTPCLATIEGWVQDGDALPQDGYVVKVVNRDTGQTISSRYLTGSDPDTAEAGFFRVVLYFADWQNTDAWFLQIAPSPDRIETFGPSLTFTVAPSALLEIEGMVTVLAPDYEGLLINYSGTVETEDMRPLAEAAIRFTSTNIVDPATGVVGFYTTTVFTDVDGAFTDVPLLGTVEGVPEPPTYEVVITPSQNDDGLGVLREERRLGLTAAGQLFTVPRRARFGGIVQTVDGLGMIDARVVSRPRGGDRGGTLQPVAFFARSNNTTTDPDGLFDLPLDIGFYDVVIEPPMGTNFPWRIERDVAVGGGGPRTSIYNLEHPIPVTGVITWAVDDTLGNAVPVAGGEVRAYGIVEDDRGVRAVLIGRTITDETGAYTLLLPPSF